LFKSFRFTFDPQKKGLRKVLGDLESEIMEVVWQIGEATVRDVYESMRENRKIAYTSVMTVMKRLSDKGVLSKVKQGPGYLYNANYSKSELMAAASKRIFDGLLTDFGMPVFSHFIESVGDEDPEAMEILSKIIEEKRKSTK